MKRLTIACALAALVACGGGGGGSPWPQGWHKVPGAASTWTNGAPERQTYTYEKAPFNGTLQDLAQREIVNAMLRNRSLKFVKSDVFGQCPGLAAIATFSGGDQTLEDAFAVVDRNAIVVRYQRPAAAHDDPAAVAAMQRALCVPPA